MMMMRWWQMSLGDHTERGDRGDEDWWNRSLTIVAGVVAIAADGHWSERMLHDEVGDVVSQSLVGSLVLVKTWTMQKT